MSDPRHDLTRTPTLGRLIERTRGRLTRQVWKHGVGTVLAVLAGWLLFAFLADWGLHVPAPVRIFHALVLIGLPAWFVWRGLLRPLQRVPDDAGLAVLIERAKPGTHELFVSAAQLQRSGNGDPALIERVLAEAEERARECELGGVLDERRPSRRIQGGFACAAAVAALFVLAPNHARIFFARMFGGSTPWPQRTYLTVEVPLHGRAGLEGHERVDVGEQEIVVRVARGSDVPVLVTAEGEIPDEVTLTFDTGEEVVLASGGGPYFRQTLRSCQEDLGFRVTGGDDTDGEPHVRVLVLQPPDVAGLAVRVTPPAYSDLPEETVYDRDVEVLAGSRIEVHVLPDPPTATGQVRVLPEDRVLPLETAPFPVTDGDDPRTGLAFSLTAERSLRYRFELVDDTGLSNPDPGLFAVRVVEDRAPELTVLAPGRGDVETVVGGALPLGVRAEDDFGLASLTWTVSSTAENETLLSGELAMRSLSAAEPPGGEGLEPDPSGPAARRATGRTRLEVDRLAPDGGMLVEGQQFELRFQARDNRAPEPGQTETSAVRIRVVSADDLLRRVQDRLARARLQASQLVDLQNARRQRTEELLESLAGGEDVDEAGIDELALAAALTGQRRVQGDARAMARELSAVNETVLYARLDEKAGGLLERLDGLLADVTDRGFHPELWRDLARAHGAGELGNPGFAGHLVAILEIALQVSEDHAQAAVAALETAQNGGDVTVLEEQLVLAIEQQTETLTRLEDLLERLAAWDNFQSVLTLTRDILNRQKSLQERTRQFASDK